VAEPRGGVAPVEAGREQLAGGVVPKALDVELGPGGRRGGDLVFDSMSVLSRRPKSPLSWEPVSGIEPLTCRLQDGCSAN
jgi:hypothetical protein